MNETQSYRMAALLGCLAASIGLYLEFNLGIRPVVAYSVVLIVSFAGLLFYFLYGMYKIDMEYRDE